MSYSDKEPIVLNGYVVSADKNSDAVEVRNTKSGAFWLSWTGAGATDAVVKLQECGTVDGTFIDIAGATATISAATGSKKIGGLNAELPYVRAVVTKNTETTAVLTVRCFYKGNK